MGLRNLTIGQRLFLSAGSVLALTLVLLLFSWVFQRASNQNLREVLEVQNRKLEIAAQVELATTEMQGAQRGLMLSYAMNDPAASAQYTKLYEDSGKKIDAIMMEMQPLVSTPPETAAMEQIRRNRNTWAPRFQALVGLCQAGKIQDAYQLRNQNKSISAAMHAAATGLVTLQQKALEQTRQASEARVNILNWAAGLILGVSLALGLAVVIGARDLNCKLRAAIAEMDASAAEVADASACASSSSAIVARGTAEQASSLQETSASAEEISSMIERNAGDTRAAHKVTTRTAAVIEDTNRSLVRMQESMQQINSSCEKVGKIVKVIDEIAFQTNILALNAAVESARAGEAGMGFAVVADEVRNLARRSADAARESTALIAESISRSREGCSNLERVSGSVRKVTEDASEIARLVEQVTEGSAEQTRGIQQIARAMMEMERHAVFRRNRRGDRRRGPETEVPGGNPELTRSPPPRDGRLRPRGLLRTPCCFRISSHCRVVKRASSEHRRHPVTSLPLTPT